MTGADSPQPMSGRDLVFRVDLFANLDDEAKRRVAGALERREAAKGEQVVRQGDEADELFLVEVGDLIVTIARDGNAVPVGQLSAGEFFGETALLQELTRTATVTALADVVLWTLSREHLLELMEAEPTVFARLGEEMRRREVANALRVLQ